MVSQRWAPGPRRGRERRRGSGACGGDAHVLVCGGRPDPGVAGRGQVRALRGPALDADAGSPLRACPPRARCVV